MKQCGQRYKRFGKKRCLRFRDMISNINFVKVMMEGPKIHPSLKEEFNLIRRM